MKKILKNMLFAVAIVCVCSSSFSATKTVAANEAAGTDYVLRQLQAEYSESLWASAPSYDMTALMDGGANTTGSVQYLLLGTQFYFKQTVHDETRNNGDTPSYAITIGGKKQEMPSGRYFEPPNFPVVENAAELAWPRMTANDFKDTLILMSVSYTAGKDYVFIAGYDLGEAVTEGGKISLRNGHGDPMLADDQDGWADWGNYPHSVQFAQEFTISTGSGEVGPSAPEDFVVGKAAEYGESVWAAASSFPLTATKGVMTGAADVKLVLIGTQLYFRLSAHDATKLEHDTPTFVISVGDVTFKWDRSAYLQEDVYSGDVLQWPRETPNGSHTYMKIEYKDETYVWTAAYDLTAKNAVNGARVNVSFRHCDMTAEPAQWQDNDSNYENIAAFENTVYLGEYTETDPLPPLEPEPEYPPDPEPEPGKQNPDYNITMTDLAKLPKADDADWANIQKYDMIAKNGNSEGAKGTVQVVTCDGNIIFRVEIHDDTISWNRDARKLVFGNEDLKYSSQGNYDTSQQQTGWWAIEHNDFTQPVLGYCELRLEEGTDKTGDQTDEAHPYGNSAKGVYVYYIGYQIRDKGYDVTPGKTIRAYLSHADSRHKGHIYNSDNAFHTIYFDQTLTFGEPADTTVRPGEVTEGFTGSAGDTKYNMTTVSWDAFGGAESYAVMLYRVNPEGTKEPYEFIKMTEGYVGEETLTLGGLAEKTKYVVQVLALDENGATIAASELIAFTTAAQNQTTDPGNTQKPGNPEKPGGCNGGVWFGVGGGLVAVCAAVAAIVIIRKKKRK